MEKQQALVCLFIYSGGRLELEYAAFLPESTHRQDPCGSPRISRVGNSFPGMKCELCRFLDVHSGTAGMWHHSRHRLLHHLHFTSIPEAEAWGRAVQGSDEVFWEAWRAGKVWDPPLDRAVTHVGAGLSSLPELQLQVPRAALAGRNLPWSVLST